MIFKKIKNGMSETETFLLFFPSSVFLPRVRLLLKSRLSSWSSDLTEFKLLCLCSDPHLCFCAAWPLTWTTCCPRRRSCSSCTVKRPSVRASSWSTPKTPWLRAGLPLALSCRNCHDVNSSGAKAACDLLKISPDLGERPRCSRGGRQTRVLSVCVCVCVCV